MSPSKLDHFYYNERGKKAFVNLECRWICSALIGEIKAKVKTRNNPGRDTERDILEKNCPGNDAFTRHSSGSKTT